MTIEPYAAPSPQAATMTIAANDVCLLNVLTKYPSIPTYHKQGGGRLTSDLEYAFPENSIVTEQIAGMHVRIVLHRDQYLIGSRERLLLLYNPEDGIVDCVRRIAETLRETVRFTDTYDTYAFYGELYGHKIGKNAKEYGGALECRAFMLFDAAAWVLAHWRGRHLAEVGCAREASREPFVGHGHLTWNPSPCWAYFRLPRHSRCLRCSTTCVPLYPRVWLAPLGFTGTPRAS